MLTGWPVPMAGDSNFQARLTFPPMSGLSLRTKQTVGPLGPPPRASACLASSSKTRTRHKVCVGRGAYDPSQNPGSILRAFSSIQEAKDGGDLGLVPQPQTSKRKCPHVIMAPWVLRGQGHSQLTQETKRVTTHHCKVPACGGRAGASVPPLLSTGGLFGSSL